MTDDGDRSQTVTEDDATNEDGTRYRTLLVDKSGDGTTDES